MVDLETYKTDARFVIVMVVIMTLSSKFSSYLDQTAMAWDLPFPSWMIHGLVNFITLFMSFEGAAYLLDLD